MQWTTEAEEALNKVPFFVRPRARARVEQEAAQAGKTQVTLADVRAARQRLLSGMAAEVKGYQLELCFGPGGCPNQIMAATPLSEHIEKVLRAADLLGFLKSKGIQDLKHHHEFRVALAECPNACSQVQIKDVGIMAAHRPRVSAEPCSECNGCVTACREEAIQIDPTPRPVIDRSRCVSCGQCIPACPTGTLVSGVKGYRVQLGGKLGRHPQLARELPGIYDEATVPEIVNACLELYKTRDCGGERFGAVLTPEAFQSLAGRFRPFV
ncbi:MAG: 4Fe-4S binding protein [Desulfobacterales bacterium]|nr:4Fe-4S binding protein [Desulfobacterales bacterium]